MVSTGNREELVLLPPGRFACWAARVCLTDPREESGGKRRSRRSYGYRFEPSSRSNNEMGAWRIGATLS